MNTAWITIGYLVSYGAIVAYLSWMMLRITSLRRNSAPRR